jgi:hypothetical protein
MPAYANLSISQAGIQRHRHTQNVGEGETPLFLISCRNIVNKF